VRQANGAAEINAVLRQSVEGVWLLADKHAFVANVRLRGGEDLAGLSLFDDGTASWLPADWLDAATQTEPLGFV
jgi:hypothetical protein